MSWSTLRPQLATLIESLPLIQEVSSTPKIAFNGYPAAYIVPSELESDYETNIENQRIYSFLIRVFYETKNTGVGEALNKLEESVDAIIDEVDLEDKRRTGMTVGVGMPAKYTYINISAVPGIWGEIIGDQLLFAEIRVRIKVSYDAH